jgi:8-oxo-dGTP pyrophosphatase MutT (NUDIX family)
MAESGRVTVACEGDVFTSVAAILTVGRGYALQLRDREPSIVYPGHWGFFGGQVEPGETPGEAIHREIREELGVDLQGWQELWEVPYLSGRGRQPSKAVIFAADASSVWHRHRLREGLAAGVFCRDRLPAPMIPLAVALLERYEATNSIRP